MSVPMVCIVTHHSTERSLGRAAQDRLRAADRRSSRTAQSMNMEIAGYQLIERIYASAATIVSRGVRESDGLPVILKYPTSEHPSLAEIARYRHEHDVLQLI